MTGLQSRWPLAVEGRLSTGHLWFVLSTWQQLSSCRARCPDSGLVQTELGYRRGPRGPPPQSEHPDGSRYPRFVLFVPSGSWLGLKLGLWQHRLRGSREVGVLLAHRLRRHHIPASVALARRPLHARCAVLHDLDTAVRFSIFTT